MRSGSSGQLILLQASHALLARLLQVWLVPLVLQAAAKLLALLRWGWLAVDVKLRVPDGLEKRGGWELEQQTLRGYAWASGPAAPAAAAALAARSTAAGIL